VSNANQNLSNSLKMATIASKLLLRSSMSARLAGQLLAAYTSRLTTLNQKISPSSQKVSRLLFTLCGLEPAPKLFSDVEHTFKSLKLNLLY